MASNKLEISGKGASDPSPATYKQIPEADMEDEPLTRPKSLVKSQTNSPEVDGAHEKMLPEEETKVSPHSDVTTADIKFVANDKQNGDAKIDIGDLKSTFVGMGKEELMKYANDPFWIRLRWILFIGFWLLWAGMLVGAILIIIAAPKCDPPKPKTWWEQGPLTEIDLTITAKDLQEIKDNGVQGVIINWPFDAYLPLNSSAEFVNFLQAAKTTDVNVIVDLKPGHSAVWFEKSEGKDDNYYDYYIWKAAKSYNGSGSPVPPNNWLSPSDKSSWIYSDARQEFYYAPFKTPQLNFRSDKVVNEFSDVISNFIKAGAKGIRLTGAPYLLVDPSFTNNAMKSGTPFVHNQYGFYKHSQTENLKDIGLVINKWRGIVKNLTSDNGPFMLSEDLTTLEPYKINSSLVIDLPKHSMVFYKPVNTSVQFKKDLQNAFDFLENKWGLWENKNSGMDPDVIDIVTLMLSGTTLIPSNYKVNKELLALRQSPSVMHGSFQQYVLENNSTYAFIRVAPGNPGYVVALNPTYERVMVNFPLETGKLDIEEVTVQFISQNYNETGVELKVKVDGHAVPLSPRSAVILTYVPKP